MAQYFTTGDSGATARSVSTQEYPIDMARLIRGVQGQIGGLNTGQATAENLEKFLSNPLSNELFQGTIGTLLDSLRDSEGQSREALADQFRIAGGGQGGALQSGAFANAAVRNEQNILQNRSNVVAQRASETFRNLLSGLGLGLQAEEAQTTPARLGLGLIGAIRPTSTTESRYGGFSGVSGGGGGGGGGGIMDFGSDMMAKYGATSGNNPYSPFYRGDAFTGENSTYNQNLLQDYYDSLRSNNFTGFSGGGYAGLGPQTAQPNTTQLTYSERPVGPVTPEEFAGMVG